MLTDAPPVLHVEINDNCIWVSGKSAKNWTYQMPTTLPILCTKRTIDWLIWQRLRCDRFQRLVSHCRVASAPPPGKWVLCIRTPARADKMIALLRTMCRGTGRNWAEEEASKRARARANKGRSKKESKRNKDPKCRYARLGDTIKTGFHIEVETRKKFRAYNVFGRFASLCTRHSVRMWFSIGSKV